MKYIVHLEQHKDLGRSCGVLVACSEVFLNFCFFPTEAVFFFNLLGYVCMHVVLIFDTLKLNINQIQMHFLLLYSLRCISERLLDSPNSQLLYPGLPD